MLVIVLVDPLPQFRYKERRLRDEWRQWFPVQNVRPRGRQAVTPDGTLDDVETLNQIEDIG